ncbi:MAG TPA: TRAP transporter small permease [Candidatus Methylomirabilis sp.]|jgi:TRAP-type C4-dicarboxylate transport system permease small subunit
MSRPGSSWWAEADRALAAVLRWGSMLCLAFLLVLLAAGVLVRFAPLFSMGWADEVVELAFAWMVFLGTAALWRENAHITVTFLPDLLGGTRGGRLLEGLVTLLALGFLVTFTWEGWLLTGQAAGNRTPILELPKPMWYVALPLSGLVMIGYTLRRSLQTIRMARARGERKEIP